MAVLPKPRASGVYALPSPRLMRIDPALKRQLGAELRDRLDGWRAADIAGLMGTDQPRISELRRGILHRFSLETLIRYATRLRLDVTLSVGQRPIEQRCSGTRQHARGRGASRAR